VTTAEAGFSLDEFIITLKAFATTEGLPQIAAFVLRMVDQVLGIQQTAGPQSARRPCPHCGGTQFMVKDAVPRRLRTSIGVVQFAWRRLQCLGCRKLVIPLRDFLRLRRWQSKTSELEKVVLEVFTEQSYRRGTDHFRQIGVIPVPHSTGQRWVLESAAGTLATPQPEVAVLMADGTGFPRRPEPQAGTDNQGEVRVTLGLTRQGHWVPLGATTTASWQQIATDVQARVGQGAQAPVMAVVDGERGLAEALAGVANQVQRCEWHLVDQLRYALYDDGLKKPAQQPWLHDVAALVKLQVPASELEPVAPAERAALEQKLFDSAEAFDRLIAALQTAGHTHAATYLRQAQRYTFRWLAFWLKTGFRCPRTTSYLERLMREIGRRLKKIAFGWSEKGAAQMTRLILRKIVNPDEWDAYWKKILRLDGHVNILFRSVHATQP
jgi:hypothetical protein